MYPFFHTVQHAQGCNHLFAQREDRIRASLAYTRSHPALPCESDIQLVPVVATQPLLACSQCRWRETRCREIWLIYEAAQQKFRQDYRFTTVQRRSTRSHLSNLLYEARTDTMTLPESKYTTTIRQVETEHITAG